MKKKKYKRCSTMNIVTVRHVYTCRYNINLCLISVTPEISPDLMSLYRGTSPAELWNLASDLGGYVDA